MAKNVDGKSIRKEMADLESMTQSKRIVAVSSSGPLWARRVLVDRSLTQLCAVLSFLLSIFFFAFSVCTRAETSVRIARVLHGPEGAEQERSSAGMARVPS